MIAGVGLDLVDIREFQTEVDEKRQAWLERVFTVGEREYCSRQPDPYRHFAGTLAAKEATLKAFGTGWTDKNDWQNIEVTRELEKPSLVLSGPLMEMSLRMKISRLLLTITHTRDYAAALVVLES
jgi:holo-[acyl-carrier protein] synthase